VAIAGILGAVGSFGALTMSFTRLPVVMAEDGYLPKVFTKRYSRSGAPWVAVIACALFWAVCYPLGFERSLILDVLLTGLSILLEFWALAALRIREPGLSRPYRVPGGTIGAILIGLPPLALIITALVRNSQEAVGSTNELVIGAVIVFAGFAMYFLTRFLQRKSRPEREVSVSAPSPADD
jgi:amino acid transporter